MENALPIAIQVVALLFAVSFHESAHGLAALACGDPTAREASRERLVRFVREAFERP